MDLLSFLSHNNDLIPFLDLSSIREFIGVSKCSLSIFRHHLCAQHIFQLHAARQLEVYKAACKIKIITNNAISYEDDLSLPDHITHFYLYSSGVVPSKLPNNLKYLDLVYLNNKELYLPPLITHLRCQTAWLNLIPNINTVGITHLTITTIPSVSVALPPSVTHLKMPGSIKLKALPPRLRYLALIAVTNFLNIDGNHVPLEDIATFCPLLTLIAIKCAVFLHVRSIPLELPQHITLKVQEKKSVVFLYPSNNKTKCKFAHNNKLHTNMEVSEVPFKHFRATCFEHIELLNLPTNITHLTLSSNFEKEVDNLPVSVTHLTFGVRFNEKIHNFPPNLKYLNLGYMFNRPIGYLPPTLKIIKFGSHFNQPIDDTLPQSLKELQLGKHYDQPLLRIPPSLKSLHFSSYMAQQLHLPSTITRLIINIKQQISQWPPKLKSLDLIIPPPFHEVLPQDLPLSLTNLTVAGSLSTPVPNLPPNLATLAIREEHVSLFEIPKHTAVNFSKAYVRYK